MNPTWTGVILTMAITIVAIYWVIKFLIICPAANNIDEPLRINYKAPSRYEVAVHRGKIRTSSAIKRGLVLLFRKMMQEPTPRRGKHEAI